MFDPAQGAAEAMRALANPKIDPVDLMTIAGAFPDLAPTVASHPQLYPELASWLEALGRPEVSRSLAAPRRVPSLEARAPRSAAARPTGAAAPPAGAGAQAGPTPAQEKPG
ncbi:MAG: hypothetical protein LBU05_03910, partial [Bifidobacteriaceae bacterium]|nr:hypothetical protein [Bifidobacteriaceae bacterium]